MAKSEKMVSISPSRLKHAREYYGLSIQDVSHRIKSIKSEDLVNFENGIDFPSYAKLEALANLYNRPLLYFFFQTEPKEDNLSAAFRSVEMKTGYELSMKVRTMIEKADWYRLNLIELFNNVPPVCFTALLESEGIDSKEKLSVWLREKLDLSLANQKKKFMRADNLLEYLREKFYNIGIYIFKDSFKSDDVSGLCLYDDSFPVILLNNKTSFTRQIFTVFHEVFHLFCKEVDVYYSAHSEELACNVFASEFLIPDDDLKKTIADRTYFEDKEYIQSLANEYTVSPSAIAYRLLTEGKISEPFFDSIQTDGVRKMNSVSAGGNFYFTRISYLGKPYLKRVFSDYYAGKINVSAVGKYTGLKASHISSLSSAMFGGVL